MDLTGRARPMPASPQSPAPSPARPGVVPGSLPSRHLTAHLHAPITRKVCVGAARTAARPRFVLMTEDKAALLKIVGRHFDGHTIANQSFDPVLLHLACRVGHDLVASIEVNAIARIRQ